MSFPDVPGAITEGTDEVGARAMAAEALGLMLVQYLADGKPLPEPSIPREGQIMIGAELDLATKVAVLEAFRESGITEIELGRRLGKDEQSVRRILDPNHATKMVVLAQALTALGRRFVIGTEID